jgi:hypothetical protein
MKGIMQKQNPIDDLFRRGLADYTVRPSDERRGELIKDVGTQVKRPWSMWWLAGLLGLIIVGVGTAVILNIESREKSPIANPVAGDNRPLSLAHDLPITHADRTTTPALVATDPASTSLKLNDKAIETPPVLNPVTPPLASPEKNNPAPLAKTREAASVKHDTIILPAHDSKPPSLTRSHDNSGLPKKWNISLGAYYTPEWMFNTLNGDKYVNNMGVEGTFHFGRYSVRTGVGLSITTGWHEVLVQSNPYLGTYQALDSIIFTWDATHYKLNSTYFTKGTNVYDTSLQYTYTNIKKQYTYLQIPLVLGYDFWQNNWLTLGFRAGAVMSLLLNTQNLSTAYDSGKDRIITINNVTPDRIQMNWQAMGGINAAFRLSRRFSIELEPDVRYYFNSVYEPSELTKKPWSIGVRTAFIVTF